MKKTNQLKAGSILSYLQMGLHIVVGLLYTPLMIKCLGQSEYGLYNTVASTISMLSVLNLGFTSGYIKFFSVYRANGDKDAIERLNGLFIIIFTVIGTVALLCGLFLTNNLHLVFKNGLTEAEYKLAKVLMIFLTLNLALSLPMSVFQCIINAHEKFIVLKGLGLLKTVLTPLLTIPLLLLGYGSIGVVAVTVAINILADVIYIYYSRVFLKARFHFKGIEKGVFADLFKYTAFIAINIITDQVNWNIDKFILGRYCGTLVVAVYSAGALLQTYYQMLSLAVSNVFIPRIHQIINDANDSIEVIREKLNDVFIRVGRIQYLVIMLVLTGFILFGKHFISMWIGSAYRESYYVALLLMVPVTIPLIQNIGTEIQRAQNKHQLRSIIYLFMAAFNLVITIFLSQRYGAIGAALGTTISLVVSTGIIMNLLYYFVLHIDVVRFWKSILMLSRSLPIVIVIGVLLNHLPIRSGLLKFTVSGVIYTASYVLFMYFMGMNEYEKNLIRVPLQRVLKRLTGSKGEPK